MPITLNQLKQKAIAAGYNLSGEVFQLRDWSIIQGFLAFDCNIQAEYSSVIRDIASSADSVFDPHFTFTNKTEERPVAGQYSYGTINVHAGLNMGITETVSIKSTAKVEIVQNGVWTPVTAFELTYTAQDMELPFRFIPEQTGNSIEFTSPTFTSLYLFVSIPFEGGQTPSICGEAVCGLTIVGDE